MRGPEFFRNVSKKRVGIALAGLTLVVGGCKGAFEGQVGSQNLVDCNNGPRANVLEQDLPAGQHLDLSNYTNSNADLSFISGGNGISTPKLPNEAQMMPDGEVLFDNQDEKIHFSVRASVGPNQTTHFKVNINCITP
jgi:hypothetical protein